MKATELLDYLKEIQKRQQFLKECHRAIDQLEDKEWSVENVVGRLGFHSDEMLRPYVKDAMLRCKADCERFLDEKNVDIPTDDLKLLEEKEKGPF
jgi:hypothetical protein